MKLAAPEPENLDPQVAALQELNKLKTVLLNTAAHELSTPLIPIQLQVALLQGSRLGQLNPKQRDAVETIQRNVERLSTLIHDLLDVAEIESNRLAARRQKMDLSRAAAEAVESVQAAAQQAQIEIVLNTRGELAIDADPQRMRQLFQALLGNAIKFTPAGGRVTVTTHEEEGVAICEIQDTGIGLKPEDFQKLFQPFGQAFDTNQKTRAGVGLGLAIAQGIVEQHGGRIWCDSAGPGTGSTFAFAITLVGQDQQGAMDVMRRLVGRLGVGKQAIRRKGPWLYFRCPLCRSADIHMRLIKNQYDCGRCGHVWR